MILFIRFPNIFIIFICPHNIKSSSLKNPGLIPPAPANSETIFIFTYLLLFKLMAKIQFKLYSNPQKH